MNKTDVLAAILKVLSDELDAATRGARASFAAATDPDSRAENKYDTRTLEASYVARGQAQRVSELTEALHHFEAMAQHPQAVPDVRLGALITLDDGQIYLMGPGAGGTEVVLEGHEILVITPASPLGYKLMGKKAGDSCEWRPGMVVRLSKVE